MHGRAGEHAVPPPSEGVAVDVGPDAGAMIIIAPASWSGREIEIERAADGKRTHAEVGRRLTQTGSIHAAVISGLTPGLYRVMTEPDTPVEIRAGSVTTSRSGIG